MSRIVFLLAICGFGCINDAATAESSWTVMIYADAGDDAMREITDCMLSQLLLVRTTEQVNVIMEVGFQNDPSDKHPGDIHWTKNELCGEDGSPIVPHWSGAYRLALEPDHAGAFKFLEYRGNVDFEATEELSDFIRSAQRCYPAKHNLLIIKAHGPPLPSLFFRQTVLDERTPASSGLADLLNRLDFHDIQMYDDDSLSSTNAIARAVHDIFIDPKLDIIAFDSCFRSFIESAFALATSSDLLIASEDLIYIDERWHYEDWLPKLVLDDALEKEYLGKLIVDSFEMRNASHMAASSLALIDLREIPQLLAPLDQISSQLTATGSLERFLCLRPPPYDDANVDLFAFASSLGSEQDPCVSVSVALSDEADEFESAFETFVYPFSSSSSRQMYKSHGLAIYFPDCISDVKGLLTTGPYDPLSRTPLPFVANHPNWPIFLERLRLYGCARR